MCENDKCPVVLAIDKLGGNFSTIEEGLFVGRSEIIRYSEASYRASKLNIKLASHKLIKTDFEKIKKIAKHAGEKSSKISKKIANKNKILIKKFIKLSKQIINFEDKVSRMENISSASLPVFNLERDLYEPSRLTVTTNDAIKYINMISINGKKPSNKLEQIGQFDEKLEEFMIINPKDISEMDVYVNQMTDIYKYLEKLEKYQIECINVIENVIEELIKFTMTLKI